MARSDGLEASCALAAFAVLVPSALIPTRFEEEEEELAYVLAARWVAKEGEEEDVLAAVLKVIDPSRAEDGCLFFQANRDPDDPRVFFFFEIYRDEAAFTAHTRTPYIQRHIFGDAIPRLADRQRTFYRTID